MTHVSFRVSPVLLARIEQLAAARGSSRSAAVKAAILEATVTPGEQSVPDEQECLKLLGEAARSGSVAAMRELRAYHRDRRGPGSTDAVSELDDLAARRHRGADR